LCGHVMFKIHNFSSIAENNCREYICIYYVIEHSKQRKWPKFNC
jgi:hypothetical protein